MKRILFIVYFLCYLSSVRSQCTVDVGSDPVVCSQGMNGWVDTLQINPTLTGANGPFTCHWDMSYTYAGLPITADQILDTVGVISPRIVRRPYIDESYLPLSLTVIDSLGNVCRDTMLIRFSQGVSCLADCQFWNVNATHVSLFSCIGGGISPLSYVWSPSDYLSDSTSAGPVASPPDGHFWQYQCTVTDSAGCPMGASICSVNLNPNGSNEIVGMNLKIYPDPIEKASVLKFDNYLGNVFEINIYDGIGNLISKTFTDKNTSPIGQQRLSNGLYYLTIKDSSSRFSSVRFSVY